METKGSFQSFAFASLLLLGSSASTATSCSQAPESASAQSAQRLLDALIEVNGVPGMGAAVASGDTLIWVGCAGLRDRERQLPVIAKTQFRLASVSKVLTTTVMARMAERQELDLDAPIGVSLPWLPKHLAPLNLRQLSAHASGIAHYTDADQVLTETNLAPGERRFSSARKAVQWFAKRPLLTAPGTKYEYSSWGYTLIGALIEARTGIGFVDSVRALTPGLGFHQEQGGTGPAESKLYNIDGATPRLLPRDDMSYSVPGGGLAASPSAVARFAGRLMRGDLVRTETWAAMRQPFVLNDGSPVGERDFKIGLGWRVSQDLDGAKIVHHAGIAEGARAGLVLWPDEQIAASVMSNAIWVSSIESTAMLLAAPFRAAPRGLRAVACPLDGHRYHGKFDGKEVRGKLRFVLERGRCVGELWPDAELLKMFATARAWPGKKLQIIALDNDGDLERAALVTPFGLYELRSSDAGWKVRFVSKTLELNVSTDARASARAK
jgi:serine beta-lactamase-like protein LACTB, mitochondrial